MKYVLFGAGLQGTAIAFDLLRHAEGTAEVAVVDGRTEALDRLAARLADGRLRTVRADVRDEAAVSPLLERADVAISAVNYWHNDYLAERALLHHAHFLDLGGNNDVVAREFALDERAAAQGVSIIPDCGLAPGLAGILGYHLAAGLDKCLNVRLRVGGLPADPRPPLNYKIVFSVQGLLNEYIEPAVVIRRGRLLTVPSLDELETLSFPAPFGELEAFQTSGGTSTLPRTLAGKVQNLDYKTIRYPGHCAQMRLLMDLGFGDDTPREFPQGRLSPRAMLAHLLQTALDLPGPDVVLLRAEADGYDAQGSGVRRVVQIIDRHDEANDISAMMRMTGYPAAIIAHMLADGRIAAPGARCQELVVPAARMIGELRRRGVQVEETCSVLEDPA